MEVSLIGLGAMGALFAPTLQNVLGDDNFKIIAAGESVKRG